MTVTTPAIDHAPPTRSRDVTAHRPPTGREEEWRFTPLPRLRGLGTGQVDFTGTARVDVEAGEGVSVESVPMSDPRVAYEPTHFVAAQAMAHAPEALVITFARESRADASVRITATGQPCAGHVVVVAEPFAEGNLVIEHAGDGVYAANIEVRLAAGARLTFASLQQWHAGAVHVGQHHASLGRDSSLRMAHITLGGDVVRLEPTVSYEDRGGDAEILGLYFSGAGQHLEHRVFVDHDRPNCRSFVLYKGALDGEGARSVWIGDVLVRAQAVGIDTYEVNRNLILSDGARADSVPNLELETGEIVGAGHASATGRFDDEQLFYLRSRGIPEDIARLLVVRGFFADVLGRIGLPALSRQVMDCVDDRLGVDLSGTALLENGEGAV